MIINKVIKAFLIALSVLFVVLQILQIEFYAEVVKTSLFVLLLFLFLREKDCDCKFFLYFLSAFALAQVVSLSSWYITIDYETTIDYFYYVSNILYILAYIFLIIQVSLTMNLREVVSKFYIHIFILIVLDIFTVSIVTATTENTLSFYEYSLEYMYNAVVMILLSIAMVNFMYRDDKKSINMLVASIFILFSEVLQLAYFYIVAYNELNVMCSIFLVLGFVFFYIQSREEHVEQADFLEEHLKA